MNNSNADDIMIRFGSKKEERLSSKGKVSVCNVRFSPQSYASTNFAKATKKTKKQQQQKIVFNIVTKETKTKQNKHLKEAGGGERIFLTGDVYGKDGAKSNHSLSM